MVVLPPFSTRPLLLPEYRDCMTVIHHALVLNLHQPHGNLELLLEQNPQEAREILFAYDRIARFLWSYEEVAKVHLSLSGSLLETLSSQSFQKSVYGIVDCGSLLWHLQNRQIIEILGTAYYHPVLPLIPSDDWKDHLSRWLLQGSHLFWRQDFKGFWPPELGFSMELIPLLNELGYRYVVVDSEHVSAISEMTEGERLFKPHVARYGNAEIIVIVRHRELSNALANGTSYAAFKNEVTRLTRGVDHPLVTTCSDGENGAWYRNTHLESNFWGGFYGGLLEDAQAGGPIKPNYIHDYLDAYGAHGLVKVETGAWNTEWHNGKDFGQWAGGPAQKETLDRIRKVSHEIHRALTEAPQRELGRQEAEVMTAAHQRLLRAETSCNFYWGETWVSRANRDLDEAESTLARFRAKKYLMDADPGWIVPGLQSA
jgi:hypothetical protein